MKVVAEKMDFTGCSMAFNSPVILFLSLFLACFLRVYMGVCMLCAHFD